MVADQNLDKLQRSLTSKIHFCVHHQPSFCASSKVILFLTLSSKTVFHLGKKKRLILSKIHFSTFNRKRESKRVCVCVRARVCVCVCVCVFVCEREKENGIFNLKILAIFILLLQYQEKKKGFCGSLEKRFNSFLHHIGQTVK